MTFSLALPALLLAGLGAMNYAALVTRKSTLQQAADTAALSAVRMLNVAYTTDQSIAAGVQANVKAALYSSDPNALTIASQVGGNRTTVSVQVSELRDVVGGQLLGSWKMTVQANSQATLVGGSPLCLLTLDKKSPEALHLEKNAQLTATGCTIFSDSADPKGLQADNGAIAITARACTVGGYSIQGATMTPTPVSDCPYLPDPLKGQPLPTYSSTCITMPYAAGPLAKILPGGLAAGNNTVTKSTLTLDPGTYCGGLHISGSAQVTLNPGLYVMQDGPLVVDGKSSMVGQGVSFFFTGNAGGVRFDKDTTISLTAPTSGAMAGYLFREDPTVSSPIPPPLDPNLLIPPPPPPPYSPPMRQYQITSDNAHTMLGTIYLPVGRVVIDSKKAVADQSAYTVIVAQQIEVFDGPDLHLNANYASTNVPVPTGVGPSGGSSVLTR